MASSALRRWRAAVPLARLLIVRRGTELGRIDLDAARELGIEVQATPYVNSPYVAEHMERQLRLDGSSRLAAIGVGHIGAAVVRSAVKAGAEVRGYSPTLADANNRIERLAELALDERVECADTIADALEDATHVAIAAPWVRTDGKRNAGIIGVRDLERLASPVRLVSVSHPELLELEAWAELDRRAAAGTASVRVDTGVELARDLARSYPHLDAAHDQAFADRRCQQALDRAVLETAERFLKEGAPAVAEAWLR